MVTPYLQKALCRQLRPHQFSKGVQEEQENIAYPIFRHQTTLNPGEPAHQGFGKVAGEVTSFWPLLPRTSRQNSHSTGGAPPLIGGTSAGAHTPQGQGQETLVSFVLFMTQKVLAGSEDLRYEHWDGGTGVTQDRWGSWVLVQKRKQMLQKVAEKQ